MTSEWIWPWWVRLSHWLIAIGIFVIWGLATFFYETDVIHRNVGYAVLALMVLRIVMGIFTHTVAAKLTWPHWQAVVSHVDHLKHRQLPAIHGHNPLGQLAVYVMWLLMALLGFTGWLSRTDAYWGEDWPVDLHGYLSNALMGMVVLHLVAVIGMSKLQRKPLVRAMLTGKH